MVVDLKKIFVNKFGILDLRLKYVKKYNICNDMSLGDLKLLIINSKFKDFLVILDKKEEKFNIYLERLYNKIKNKNVTIYHAGFDLNDGNIYLALQIWDRFHLFYRNKFFSLTSKVYYFRVFKWNKVLVIQIGKFRRLVMNDKIKETISGYRYIDIEDVIYYGDNLVSWRILLENFKRYPFVIYWSYEKIYFLDTDNYHHFSGVHVVDLKLNGRIEFIEKNNIIVKPVIDEKIIYYTDDGYTLVDWSWIENIWWKLNCRFLIKELNRKLPIINWKVMRFTDNWLEIFSSKKVKNINNKLFWEVTIISWNRIPVVNWRGYTKYKDYIINSCKNVIFVEGYISWCFNLQSKWWVYLFRENIKNFS